MASDSGPGLLVVTRAEALAVQLGSRAAETAGRLLRAGGYAAPTADQWRLLSGALSGVVLAAAEEMVRAQARLSDEEIDGVVDAGAAEIVVSLFGRPPVAH